MISSDINSLKTTASLNARICTGNALHAMDCTDVVIGAARGGRSRILDYYTRDRSTPRLDEFYGGRQSLTGAVGMEVDGTTIIKFRRRLATSKN